MSEPTSGQYREFFKQVGLGYITQDYIAEVISGAKERSLAILKQKLFDRIIKYGASLSQLMIFRYLVKANQFDKARELISGNEDLFSKSLALIELAQATQDKKDIEAARKNFADITVSDRISELAVSARIELLAEMARLTRDRAYLDKALLVSKESKEALKDRDGHIALIALMESLFELGMIEEMRKIGNQFGLCCEVASITKEEKDIEKARKAIISRSGNVWWSGSSEKEKIRRMLDIARISKDEKDIDYAINLISGEDGDNRDLLRMETIIVLAQIGNIERARELTNRVSNVYTGLRLYFLAWVCISRISKDKKDIAKVKSIFKERFHDHFVSQEDRANALVDIAELTGNRQDVNRALEAIEEMPIHDSHDETRIASLQLSILEIL